MPTEIRIQVDGAVILYIREGVWNLVFITEWCHPVEFHDPINRPHRVILAGTTGNRLIRFSTDGDYPSAGRLNPEIVHEFVNLADPRLHGSGNLEVVSFRPPSRPVPPRYPRNYVHMTIPYGELSILRHSSKSYCVRDIKSNCLQWEPSPAEAFEISFTLPDSSTLHMDVDEVGDSPLMPRRSYSQSTSDIILTIDNRCHKEMGYNDSEHVYDWVKDKRGDRRFEWGDCMYVCPDSVTDFIGLGMSPAMFSRDGNCDPVIIEPPPGP